MKIRQVFYFLGLLVLVGIWARIGQPAVPHEPRSSPAPRAVRVAELRPTSPAPVAPHRPTHRLTVASAQIAPHKAGGREWDAGRKAPDPYVRIEPVSRCAWGPRATTVQKNTLSPVWNQIVEVSLDDTVRLEVWDDDVVSHDPIGQTILVLNQDMAGRDVVLSFGQVRELRIRLDANPAAR